MAIWDAPGITRSQADKRYRRLVPASGDVTGVTDVAAINAELVKGGAVGLVPGAVYYVNGTLIPRSHTYLDATGATINVVTGTLTNIIRNLSAYPTRTVTDASAAATSGTVTSATAAFVSGDIGTPLGVTGAGAAGTLGVATLYGTVLSVSSPTTAPAWAGTTAAGLGGFIRPTTINGYLYSATVTGTTGGAEPTWPTTVGATVADGTTTWKCLGQVSAAKLNTAADTTINNATLSVFSTRDTDLTVRGGAWNFCDQSAGTTAFTQFATCFRRIDGLNISGMTITQAGSSGLGGRFNLSISDVTSTNVRDIFFNNTAGDGLHVTGPASNVFIENINGKTGDDMVVLSTQDNNIAGATAVVQDTQGNLDTITVIGIHGVNTFRTFKIYDLGVSPAKFTCKRIRVDGISGTSQNEAVALIGATSASLYLDDLKISNVNPSITGSVPVISSVNTTHVGNCLFENISWTSAAACTNGIISVVDPRGELRIQNLFMNTSPAGTNIGVKITANSALSGAGFGQGITIDGVTVIAGANNVPAATFHVFSYTANGTYTLPYLHISDVKGAPTTAGSLVLCNSSLAITNLNISDFAWSGTNLIQTPTGTGAITARVANGSITGTNLASVGGPLTLKLANVDANTSGAVVTAVGVNATPIRVLAHGFAQVGAGAGLARDGAQALSLVGHGFKADLSILTPVDQDMVNNSNGALACGAGVAIFHTGGTGNGWKNLYSGATY